MVRLVFVIIILYKLIYALYKTKYFIFIINSYLV
jgi:hypothetical protein